MKIAILTLPLINNYGGKLQCYALQTVLEEMGHEVTVVDRRWPESKTGLIIRRLGSLAKCVIRRCVLGQKDIVLMAPWAEDYHIHRRSEAEERSVNENRRFVKENIHLTKPLRSSKELAEYVRRGGFDCIVVGSDQVWREIYSPDIEDFFLGFLPEDDKTVKISYAASFGTADSPISEVHLANCVRLAKRFDALSVRERSGVEILKNTFGQEARLVLDPTLLLSAEQYRFPVKGVESGEVVSYILDCTDEKEQILDKVAESLNLKSVRLGLAAGANESDALIMPSVEEWLASFANAGFVVTDSFHGCVFSIINQKPFIAIANKDRGLERFTSLLESFGLMDRLIFDCGEFERKKSLLLQPIDYEPVNAKREELVQGSLEYLTNTLKTQQKILSKKLP